VRQMFTFRNHFHDRRELFLESVSSGVITPAELDWGGLPSKAQLFAGGEEAAASPSAPARSGRQSSSAAAF